MELGIYEILFIGGLVITGSGLYLVVRILRKIL